MYTLEAKYPENLDQKKTDRLLYNLVRKYNGYVTGEGFNFGWRDMDLEFDSRNDRERFTAFVAENHTDILLTENS